MKILKIALAAAILLSLFATELSAKTQRPRGHARGELNVRTLTTATKDEVLHAVDGTPVANNVDDIMIAADMFKINPKLLVAIIVHETGWGKSYKYRKHLNVGGIKRRGGKFASHRESIFLLAKLLSEDYLNPKGRYYKGTRLKDINYYYCTQRTWAPKVESIINRMF